MAKINIPFNNTNYSIDEASLSAATAALRTHLSSVMNGTGATINFGGTSYNVDSAKLTTATNDFVSHLGTIAGSGSKVVIGGVEYSIGSDKVASAISELETVLGGLVSGGSGSDDGGDMILIMPETNFSTFLYEQNFGVYKAYKQLGYVPMLGETCVVEWDGNTYECVAQDSSAIMSGTVCLGNASGWGLSGNGEPFVIAVHSSGMATICDLEAPPSAPHTVTIYLKSSNTVILPLTTSSEFTMWPDYYNMIAVGQKLKYPLTVGETYAVEWDGNTYECIAQDSGAVVSNTVCLGNASAWGLSGNGEPFVIVMKGGADIGQVLISTLTDTETGCTHTFGISRVVNE